MCRRHGLGAADYCGLASGFLSGKYCRPKDIEGRARATALKQYANECGWRIVAAFHAVARRLSSTPATVALVWLMAQPAVTSAIASATAVGQLDELPKAADLTLDAPLLPSSTRRAPAVRPQPPDFLISSAGALLVTAPSP